MAGLCRPCLSHLELGSPPSRPPTPFLTSASARASCRPHVPPWPARRRRIPGARSSIWPGPVRSRHPADARAQDAPPLDKPAHLRPACSAYARVRLVIIAVGWPCFVSTSPRCAALPWSLASPSRRLSSYIHAARGMANAVASAPWCNAPCRKVPPRHRLPVLTLTSPPGN